MPWLVNDEPPPTRERLQTPEERARIDDTTKCILCAVCTTACPIYWGNGEFLGPAALVAAHRFVFDSRDRGAAERLAILADRSGAFKCRTVFNCTDACPFDVPQIVDGRSSKCDACAATTKAGGQPWCVRTCPSDALRYGERREILAEAHARVEAIRARYPKARVYGEAEAGGLGVVVVLPDAPEAFDLPANPQTPLLLDVWQKVVQPAAVGLTGLSVLVTGVAAIIARRNHMKELAELRAQQAQTEQNAGAQEGER
jgi:Fe-S-cluster-containing dehydrogenase component/heme exporter protein D